MPETGPDTSTPPCPAILAMRRARRSRLRTEEVGSHQELHATIPHLTLRLDEFMRTLLGVFYEKGVELRVNPKDQGLEASLSTKPNPGLERIQMRKPGQEHLSHRGTLPWETTPGGLGVPLQSRFDCTEPLNIAPPAILKGLVLEALARQLSRLEKAEPELWTDKLEVMTQLWANIKSLRDETAALDDPFEATLFDVYNYSPRREVHNSTNTPILKEGFYIEIANAQYRITLYPNSDGTKTTVKVSAQALNDVRLNDDSIDTLVTLEGHQFSDWAANILDILSEKLELERGNEWIDTDVIKQAFKEETEPSVRDSLRVLREALKRKLMSQVDRLRRE